MMMLFDSERYIVRSSGFCPLHLILDSEDNLDCDAGNTWLLNFHGSSYYYNDTPSAPICEGCGQYYADPPSTLCLGCEAYYEHQWS